MIKIKVVHVYELYNFYVYNIFILGHLMSKIEVKILKLKFLIFDFVCFLYCFEYQQIVFIYICAYIE